MASSKFNHSLSFQKELTHDLDVSYAPKKNTHGHAKKSRTPHY